MTSRRRCRRRRCAPKTSVSWVHCRWCASSENVWALPQTPSETTYPIDYVNVNMSGRRNRQRQCNSVLIVKAKNTKERVAMEAEVDVGQIDLFDA